MLKSIREYQNLRLLRGWKAHELHDMLAFQRLLANEDYLDVAFANLETPPSSDDEESDLDVESLSYHYK